MAAIYLPGLTDESTCMVIIAVCPLPPGLMVSCCGSILALIPSGNSSPSNMGGPLGPRDRRGGFLIKLRLKVLGSFRFLLRRVYKVFAVSPARMVTLSLYSTTNPRNSCKFGAYVVGGDGVSKAGVSLGPGERLIVTVFLRYTATPRAANTMINMTTAVFISIMLTMGYIKKKIKGC